MSGAVFNVEALRQKTRNARVEKSQVMQTAEDLAFDKFESIIKSDEFNQRMAEAAEAGRFSTDFYEWEYVPDEDPRFMFGGVRILDIVKRTDIKKRLNELVNPDHEENGFFVSHRVTNRPRDSRRGRGRGRGRAPAPKRNKDEPTKYALYLSWKPRPAKKAEEPKETEEANE